MKKVYIMALAMLAVVLFSCKKHEPRFETEQYSYTETYYLTDAKQDSLVLDINVEIPTKMDNDSLLAKMQKNIRIDLFGDAYDSLTNQEVVNEYAKTVKNEYKADNADMAEEWRSKNRSEEGSINPIFCAEEYLTGTVMSQMRGIVSYGVERYVFNGGAHGLNARLFENYDLKTGDKIGQGDIFVDEYEQPLTDLLVKEFIAQTDGINSIEDLENSDYEINGIVPNENFYFDTEGIVYVYNPYDIAPYAYGESVIELSWEEVEPLMKAYTEKEK